MLKDSSLCFAHLAPVTEAAAKTSGFANFCHFLLHGTRLIQRLAPICIKCKTCHR